MTTHAEPPSQAELEEALGSALPIWTAILACAEAAHAPLSTAWKPSRTGFGRMCMLQHKKRTLLYLTPDKDRIWVAIVLGERAFQLALASSLPEVIKNLFLEARPYAEGRGIRFPIHSPEDLPAVAELLEIKTTVT
ncbi:DUF3788 domain-containing protein [Geothrix campi]|uniref:DUF3788 domain-containing protein n=1 Tax=Geothrix campi TaxID=2966450 RepID=UPI0021492BE0|nr:DUF3788 domain-containing protein [Geothrix sp. SG10]